jgi:hypothetical protein
MPGLPVSYCMPFTYASFSPLSPDLPDWEIAVESDPTVPDIYVF